MSTELQQRADGRVRSGELLAAAVQMSEALKVALRHERLDLQSPYRDDPVPTKYLMMYHPYRQYAEALKAWKAANTVLYNTGANK